jgi:hypothetical protein
MRLRMICAALLVPILALSACKPNQSSGDTKGGTPGQTSDAVVFPDVFPSYIPHYPGEKKFNNPAAGITNAMFSKFAKGGTAAFLTTDSPDKVIAFYKGEFEKAGLKATDVKAQPNMNMLTYVKEEPTFETVSVVISKMPPNSSVVQIIYIPVPEEPSQK